MDIEELATNYLANAVHVVKVTMNPVLVVTVGVCSMDNCKKEKRYLGNLEDHNVKKSAHEMDEKLNSAKKKLNERY